MKTIIKFVGTNPATSHLHDQTFSAEIISMGKGDDVANMHLILLPDRSLRFDLKHTEILHFITLEGILEDEGKVGRVAIQLS